MPRASQRAARSIQAPGCTANGSAGPVATWEGQGRPCVALLNDPQVASAWRTANGGIPLGRTATRFMSELGPLMREQAAQSATLIDGARAAVDTLRSAGLKIASSTGYTREMMQPVLERAAAQGYEPDHVVCSGETPQGRPRPS